MQVDRHDTSFATPRLWHSWKMLSFIMMLFRQNCTLSQRRKLKLKATFESGSSYITFKR